MNNSTAVRHLKDLREMEVDVGHRARARALAIAIEKLSAPVFRRLSHDDVVRAMCITSVCRACAERARKWDNPRWLKLDGTEHRVPKRHRTTLCGRRLAKGGRA